jgi:hypothetical protein
MNHINHKHYFIIGIIITLLLTCCNQTGKDQILPFDCNKPNGYKIIHCISLKNCYSCGSSLFLPDEYFEILESNCSFVIANLEIPKFNTLLKTHLPEPLLTNSTIIANNELYMHLKELTNAPTDSFVVVLNNNDSVVFQGNIDRNYIVNIEMLIHKLKNKPVMN